MTHVAPEPDQLQADPGVPARRASPLTDGVGSEAAMYLSGQLNPRGLAVLQRAAGNRAVGRLVDRSIRTPTRRVLAREGPVAVTSPAPTPTAADTWGQAQSDWQPLVSARERIEAASPGTTVELGGSESIDLVASADTVAAVRRASRHRLMELMYLTWNSYRGGDLADSRKAADPAEAMVALQAKVLAEVKPMYEALEAGKPPEDRFEYQYIDAGAPEWTKSVRETVAAVAGLIAQASAEAARSDPEGAHRLAKAIVGDADWCGAFAYVQFQHAGIDMPTSALHQNPLAWTGPWSSGVGIDGFFQYRPALEIKVGDTWQDVRTFHEERGSLRRFQVLPASGEQFDKDTKQYEGGSQRGGMVGSIDALDVQPGDLVMIDRAKGTFGDHIAMCRAYDSTAHHLWTIGGNEGQPHPVNASGMWDLDHNPSAVSVQGDAKRSRVYAIARFSAVDFEPHAYRAKK